MLHGPWKEASSPIVSLHVDDKNVNGEAIAMALAYLYGHHPKLNHSNAFRVLAAASFLDLQDLCAICTDFIISELWTSNFLAYQVFAESQDYGIHGERVRNACWGYLCQSGATELKQVLPKLSSHTLHALLTSDELWVPSEEKRFELALYTLLAKGTLSERDQPEDESFASEMGMSIHSDSSKSKEKTMLCDSSNKSVETDVDRLSLKGNLESCSLVQNQMVGLANCIVDFQTGVSGSVQQGQLPAYAQSNQEPIYLGTMEQSLSLTNPFPDTDGIRTSHSFVQMPVSVEASELEASGVATEGPSEEGSSYHLNNHSWISSDKSRHCPSMDSFCNSFMLNDCLRCGMAPLSWGGRIVGKRQVTGYAKRHCEVSGEEYESFVNIFDGGSLLYSNMSFEALLNSRKLLEEFGFPCKAVNDGLWLQMLLSQRVQEIGADTCKNCCLVSMACACRQPFGLSPGVNPSGYYMHEDGQNNQPGSMGNVYVVDSSQGERNGLFRHVRVHVRGPVDGLAGIGRGNAFVPTASCPPTRFVYSRVPVGMGNRSCQQSLANDDSEVRIDHNGDLSGDGLTALVGLSHRGNNAANANGAEIERDYETDLSSRLSATHIDGPNSNGISMQMLESLEHSIGLQGENAGSSPISLDLKTPLSHFPPFRFGVEFEDVHRLNDGQVKHSPEFFYAGSLWKVSVQAFNDEDPQGRRTLGLFLHRRKAEMTDSLRKVHMYVDSREKVTARYQLICPSKREVMVFGSIKQRGTLLPKAPKGWGWRTALLFDELADLLQNGALRIAAVVQII